MGALPCYKHNWIININLRCHHLSMQSESLIQSKNKIASGYPLRIPGELQPQYLPTCLKPKRDKISLKQWDFWSKIFLRIQ